MPLGWKSPHPPSRVGSDACPAAHARGGGALFQSRSVWVRRWTRPARGSPRPSERCRDLVDAGDELLTIPSPGHEGPHEGPLVAAILRCHPFGAEMLEVGTPLLSAPVAPPRRLPTPLWAIVCLQKFHVQNRAPGRPWSPTEPGSLLALRLGDGAAPSRPLAPASSTRTRRTKCSGRWCWSLASTGRTSCWSSGRAAGALARSPRARLPVGSAGGSAAGAAASYLTPPVNSVPAAPGTSAAGAGRARNPAECRKGREEQLRPRCPPQNAQAVWARQARVSSRRVIKYGRIVVPTAVPLVHFGEGHCVKQPLMEGGWAPHSSSVSSRLLMFPSCC